VEDEKRMLKFLLVSLNPNQPMTEYKSMVGYGSHSPVQVAWKEFKIHIHWLLHKHLLIIGCGKTNVKGSFFVGRKSTVDMNIQQGVRK
jgi:hypothetical protein